MTLSGKLILVSLAAILAAILILPALALLAVLGTLAGLFVVVAALWAVVLLGERWIDEGLGGYNYLDALGESFENLFQGLCRLFLAPRRPTMRERFVAFLPLLVERVKLLGASVLLAVLFVPVVVIYGYREFRSEMRGGGARWIAQWRGAYL